MMFRYFEIRPCVEYGGATHSYLGEQTYHSSIGAMVYTHEGALKEATDAAEKNGTSVFWTLYGRDEEGCAQAIGDFETFEAALKVLNAILAPMAAARDELVNLSGMTEPDARDLHAVADDLDDIINQSTNAERL